ncbi:MAG: hypothetical protein P8Y01_05445, partial [Woeseiaceae bacterium]
DPRSVENCRKLIRELDEQRARIKPQYKALSAICLSLGECFKELKDYTDSSLFPDNLKLAQEQKE